MVFNPRRSNKLDVRIKFTTIIQSLHGCKYRDGAGRGGLSSGPINMKWCWVFVFCWLAGKVFVHCAMGLSRSSTLVLAYLMIHVNMTLADAIKAVSANRNISPNAGFLEQLRELDKELHCQGSLPSCSVNRRTWNKISPYIWIILLPQIRVWSWYYNKYMTVQTCSNGLFFIR